ncbi:MAG: hypothetical protein Q8K75_09075 [Chlamydiales bacterium]|nr:hypothetical protein [Chlamydiales bacterium]
MIPNYSEQYVLESLSKFHEALSLEIQEAEAAATHPDAFGIFEPKRYEAIANNLKNLAQNLDSLESTMRAVVTHSDSSMSGEAIQQIIYVNRQQIKEIYNNTIKSQVNLENKLGSLYRDAQKTLKGYTQEALHSHIKSMGKKAKDIGIMNADAYSGLHQGQRDVLRQLFNNAEHIDEIGASIEGPFSYAGKRGTDREKIHQQMTGQVHNEEITKKEFPEILPRLAKIPRLGSTSSAITNRTNTMCDAVKDVIKWKYHKLISKDTERPSDHSSKLALQNAFREIDDFQKFISKNPKKTYISQANELSRSLGLLYTNHFSNSEKVRAAEFFQTTNRELERFHKKFKP